MFAARVIVHIAAVLIGLALGTLSLTLNKGTPVHRLLGWIYLGAMLVTAASSFWIYEVRDGRPSIFHAVSVLIPTLIVVGIVAVRSGRLWLHTVVMPTSVLLGVITGVAQFFDDLPLPSPALNAIVFLQLPMFVGFTLIWRSAARYRSELTVS